MNEEKKEEKSTSKRSKDKTAGTIKLAGNNSALKEQMASSMLSANSTVKKFADEMAASVKLAGNNSALKDQIASSMLGANSTVKKFADEMAASVKLAGNNSALKDQIASSMLGANSTVKKFADEMAASVKFAGYNSALKDQMAGSMLGVNSTIKKLADEMATSVKFAGYKVSYLTPSFITDSLLQQIRYLNDTTISIIDKKQLHIESDGTIATPVKKFNVSEIQNEIDMCLVNSSFLSNEISFEKKIANIIKEASKQHPVISFFITYILISFLVNVFSSNFMESPVNNYQITNNRNIYVKIIQTQPKRNGVCEDSLNIFRFVSADSLFVREGDCTRSRVVGKIYLGQMVEVLYINKNWTLVKWEDVNNNTHKGWVFTRYLKRFK